MKFPTGLRVTNGKITGVVVESNSEETKVMSPDKVAGMRVDIVPTEQLKLVRLDAKALQAKFHKDFSEAVNKITEAYQEPSVQRKVKPKRK